MKKAGFCSLVVALVMLPAFAFAADEGLHLGGLEKEAKKAKIESKKNTKEAEKAAKKAAKDTDKAKKHIEKKANKVKKNAGAETGKFKREIEDNTMQAGQ